MGAFIRMAVNGPDGQNGLNLYFVHEVHEVLKSMKSMKSISAAMEQHCLHRTLWSKTPLFIAFALPPAVKFRSLVPP